MDGELNAKAVNNEFEKNLNNIDEQIKKAKAALKELPKNLAEKIDEEFSGKSAKEPQKEPVEATQETEKEQEEVSTENSAEADKKESKNWLDSLGDNVDCAKRAFKSNKYLVVCLGAAKSGKSTLLNVLTGKEVSPAGPATETTLQCSIILAADATHPEGITLYDVIDKDLLASKNENDKKKLRQSIRRLLECLNGSREMKDIDGTVWFKRPKTYRLEECRDILTNKNFEVKYQLAEIRVNIDDENNILKENVALIDMPGLDGDQAGLDKNSVIDIIPEFCHHFILVQSSITTLNSVTSKALDRIKDAHKKDALFDIIFNMFDAKRKWLDPDTILTEQNKYCDSAREEINKKIPKNRGPFKINAAMAWDAIKRPNSLLEGQTPQGLYEESNIDEWKKSLLDHIKENFEKTIMSLALTYVEKLEDPFTGEGSDFAKLDKLLNDNISKYTNDKETLSEEKKEKTNLVKSIKDNGSDLFQQHIELTLSEFLGKYNNRKGSVCETLNHLTLDSTTLREIDKSSFKKQMLDSIEHNIDNSINLNITDIENKVGVVLEESAKRINLPKELNTLFSEECSKKFNSEFEKNHSLLFDRAKIKYDDEKKVSPPPCPGIRWTWKGVFTNRLERLYKDYKNYFFARIDSIILDSKSIAWKCFSEQLDTLNKRVATYYDDKINKLSAECDKIRVAKTELNNLKEPCTKISKDAKDEKQRMKK